MYEWIQSQHQEELSLPITRLCSAFGVSRSGYYDWLRRPEPTQSEIDMEIRDQIQRIVLEFPGYGYRRVSATRSLETGNCLGMRGRTNYNGKVGSDNLIAEDGCNSHPCVNQRNAPSLR